MLLLRLECLKIISIGAHAHTLLTLELLLLTLMLTLTTGLISHDFISPEPLMLLSVVWFSLILRKEDEAQLVPLALLLTLSRRNRRRLDR